jgi:hypothetical protein
LAWKIRGRIIVLPYLRRSRRFSGGIRGHSGVFGGHSGLMAGLGDDELTGDVMDIGSHCSNEMCKQLDFLPITCAHCSRRFCAGCLSSHRASCSPVDDQSVVVCPMCARGVTFKAGEDPNVVIEEHQRQGRCDPGNYKRVHERKRCCGNGCREKLTTVNVYVCKTCGQETCVKHRFPESHGCKVVVARKVGGSGFFRSIKSFFASL